MNFFKTFLAAILAVIVGSVLSFILWIILIIAMAAGTMSGEPVIVGKSSILKLDLSYTIEDSPMLDPFAMGDIFSMNAAKKISLFKVLKAIEVAREDDKIEGIYIRLSGEGSLSSTAIIEELRNAILEFKKSGKFVYAYNETYTQGAYYLASVADKVYIHPEGMIDWSGMAANNMFYKGLFDKLDIKPVVFRPTVCKFKSAVEPFILEKMSKENRIQMQSLVNSIWSTITESISESRGISVEKLNALADDLKVSLPEEAVEYGFVDGTVYEDQMDDMFAELGVETNYQGEYSFISLGDYASQPTFDMSDMSSPEIAIIYADGQIVDGEGTGKTIYGNTLAAAIAKVRKDDDVESVVLRVNSPGGSALASDIVWREMELLKAKKPVIVSMGAYAASGGYYMAVPADVIVANKTTLTGSIGVFGMYLNVIDALDKNLGITMDGVKTNKSSGMGQSGPLTPIERASIMRSVDKVYETFTTKVAEGRNLPISRVLELSEGRVWSGTEALENGLADANGGLVMAIALAADKADIVDDYRVVEILEELEGFEAIMASLNSQVMTYFKASQLGMVVSEYERVQEITSLQGVLMYDSRVLDIK